MPLPFEPPLAPMLAKLTPEIPGQPGWRYEPKWDGFRCLVYRDGTGVYLQSRDGKPLARYFPELEGGLVKVLQPGMVLDGELVVMTAGGLDFDALQARIHPAESRVKKLSKESPASFVAFDLLAEDGSDLRSSSFNLRRAKLEERLAGVGPPAFLTPATKDEALARRWFDQFEGAGFDGVIAKREDEPYRSGARAMAKIKHLRSADCIVGGFRWNRGQEGESVGSLLLGLYDDEEVLHFVGHTSSFSSAVRRELVEFLAPYRAEGPEGEGFGGGRTPGGQSRWSGKKDLSWVGLRPELVCEVTFDHLQGNRFRHASRFRAWRPDKAPSECTFEQLDAPVPAELRAVFAADGGALSGAG